MAIRSATDEITRLSDARDQIRATLVTWGKAEGIEKLDALASTIEAIKNNGAVSATVQEGQTYTIPEGYHNGSGTVSGVAGGGNYELQSKTVTPTKQQQSITPDGGYYGLSDVTVAAIPANYQDISATTATAPDVLANKVFTGADGQTRTGTMANNGAVTQVISVDSPSYTIPTGYHNGEGAVSIDPETKTATPTKASQKITPTAGKVLSSVTINAIPDKYITTTDATATADKIFIAETAYVNGKKVTGTMADNSGTSATVSVETPSYTIPAGYHDGEGTVSVVVETKTATPTKSEQTITPTAGKVLSSVTVDPIPAEYITTSDADSEAIHILLGKTAYVNGVKLTGSMPNNNTITATIDGLTTTSYTIPAGYTAGGTVTLTDDIEQALAAI